VTLFHPILIFSALSKKIQSLTPLVEEKSREIQKNFQEDMNFSVLSDGFDSLSSTFSQIVTLVIKLEKIEAKANRGNIFDSEKYIKSLRSDILDPLKQLKSFLEKQREELNEIAEGTRESESRRSRSLTPFEMTDNDRMTRTKRTFIKEK
jgi:hypothetical protein